MMPDYTFTAFARTGEDEYGQSLNVKEFPVDAASIENAVNAAELAGRCGQFGRANGVERTAFQVQEICVANGYVVDYFDIGEYDGPLVGKEK